MSVSYPVKEFRFASRSGSWLTTSDQTNWSDIAQLILPVGSTESGSFLTTLTVPDTWNDKASCGATFRQVLRYSHGTVFSDVDLGQGYYFSGVAGQRVPFSLACKVDYVQDKYEKAIVAQWRAQQGGTAYIGVGLSSLSAVGSVTIE